MNKQTKPKKSLRDLFMAILFLILVFGLIMAITNSGQKVETLSYGDFIALEAQGDLKTIVATPIGSGGNAKLYELSGTYNKGTEVQRYNIVVSDQALEQLRVKVASGSVSYTLEYQGLVEVNWFNIIITVVFPIGLVVLLLLFIKNNNGSNNKAFDFAKSRAKLNKQSTTTFENVAGADEEKVEMAEIIDFLKNPQKYYEIGARIPKGVLLVGPPGTGKTLLARAVAGEAKVPFYSISGSDFVEMFVGVGASRVRDMFKTAKQNAPCIVFIDEIDAVGRQRGAGLGGGNDEREQTLNQLLVEMDGFGDNSGIIVMAATNRPDVLDPALLRPGRFDRQITMSNPDLKARVEILKVHARNKKLSKKINLEDIARRTPGFSGADIENLLNEAALLAARENRKEIKIFDIDEAIDRVIMGPAKKSKRYTEEEKKAVSYHESGHAIIGVKLENAQSVQKVTIVPRGQAGGYAMMTPDKEHFFETKSELLDTITGLLGGRVSEELFIGDIGSGASNDIERATQIARTMVTQLGMSKLGPIQYGHPQGSVFLGRDYMSDKNFSDKVAQEIDNEVRDIINECYEKAKEVLTENAELVHLLASHLMQIETLTKEDIYELVETKKLGWWEEKKQKELDEKEAKEKENELQDIYKKQLEAMKNANVDETSKEENNTEEK